MRGKALAQIPNHPAVEWQQNLTKMIAAKSYNLSTIGFYAKYFSINGNIVLLDLYCNKVRRLAGLESLENCMRKFRLRHPNELIADAFDNKFFKKGGLSFVESIDVTVMR
jgi:hypothetical protein